MTPRVRCEVRGVARGWPLAFRPDVFVAPLTRSRPERSSELGVREREANSSRTGIFTARFGLIRHEAIVAASDDPLARILDHLVTACSAAPASSGRWVKSLVLPFGWYTIAILSVSLTVYTVASTTIGLLPLGIVERGGNFAYRIPMVGRRRSKATASPMYAEA